MKADRTSTPQGLTLRERAAKALGMKNVKLERYCDGWVVRHRLADLPTAAWSLQDSYGATQAEAVANLERKCAERGQ